MSCTVSRAVKEGQWYADPTVEHTKRTNVLGLAVFSLIFGCCLSLLRDTCSALVAIITDIEAVIISITRIVFWFVAYDEFAF